MAEDQSVVGRRQIYYDQHGGETLICSDSEEEPEPEEEKGEYFEGEDSIIWLIGQEYGMSEEVQYALCQFLSLDASDILERFNELKLKNEQTVEEYSNSGFKLGISLEKGLSAALDSFDNLFCRRCLVFDCRLHGCSQSLISASENSLIGLIMKVIETPAANIVTSRRPQGQYFCKRTNKKQVRSFSMTIDMDQTKHQLGLAYLKALRKMIQPLLIVEPESINLIDEF